MIKYIFKNLTSRAYEELQDYQIQKLLYKTNEYVNLSKLKASNNTSIFEFKDKTLVNEVYIYVEKVFVPNSVS